MKVEPRFLKMWRELKEHGDVSTIAHLCGKKRERISKVISTGECMMEEFITINNFFIEKRNRLVESKKRLHAA